MHGREMAVRVAAIFLFTRKTKQAHDTAAIGKQRSQQPTTSTTTTKKKKTKKIIRRSRFRKISWLMEILFFISRKEICGEDLFSCQLLLSVSEEFVASEKDF
ncbi:hypothetical protein LWI28_020418 [Acer negundo]|uniref:Uncharacterized protein n=1 Tax=Acer negundo TaxID=4023 RepID=A0AAD5JC99_ACENE|nr:hypothetical protein LWI28_020418 [Acer negundo]KAK4854642.1 hypothetical protein QYF36_027110 [Acer negundo]